MNVYESVTAEILSHLEQGVVPWRKQWRTSGPSIPTNFVTKKAYRGCNVFLLGWTDHTTNSWLTYKQAQSIGAQVRKGERSRAVVFWSVARKGEQVRDAKSGELVDAGYAFAKTYNVFNVDQCDGIPADLPFDTAPFDPIAEADAIAQTYFARAGAPTLRHIGDVACYSPLTDVVTMPAREAFFTPDAYYSTLFHEATHSVLDARRMGSEFKARKFGDGDYAREELVAEFGASFLCAESGIRNERNIGDSAAYIAHWLKALRNDRTLAVSAAQRAQKTTDYVLGREFAQAAPAADLTQGVAA